MEIPYSSTSPREVDLALLLCGNVLQRVRADIRAHPRCMEAIYAWYIYKLSFLHMTLDNTCTPSCVHVDAAAAAAASAFSAAEAAPNTHRQAGHTRTSLHSSHTAVFPPASTSCGAALPDKHLTWMQEEVDMMRAMHEASSSQRRTAPQTSSQMWATEATSAAIASGARLWMECVALCRRYGGEALAQRVLSLLIDQLTGPTSSSAPPRRRHNGCNSNHIHNTDDDEHNANDYYRSNIIHNHHTNTDDDDHRMTQSTHFRSGRVHVVMLARLFDTELMESDALMALGSVTRSFRLWINIAWACASFERQCALAAAATAWLHTLHAHRRASHDDRTGAPSLLSVQPLPHRMGVAPTRVATQQQTKAELSGAEPFRASPMTTHPDGHLALVGPKAHTESQTGIAQEEHLTRCSGGVLAQQRTLHRRPPVHTVVTNTTLSPPRW